LLPTVPRVKPGTTQESAEVVQAPVEAVLIVVREVRLVHPARLEMQGDPETLVPPEHLETLDAPPFKHVNKSPRHLVTHVLLVLLDPLVPQVHLAMLDQMDNLDKEEAILNQVRQDRKAHPDPLDRQDNQDTMDNPANLLSHKKPAQDNQAHLATLDLLDHQDPLDNPAIRADLAHLAPKDLLEILVLPETMAIQATLARPVHLEALERKVFARNTAPWTVESSSKMAPADVKQFHFVRSSGDLHPSKTCPMNTLLILCSQKTAIYYVFFLFASCLSSTHKLAICSRLFE